MQQTFSRPLWRSIADSRVANWLAAPHGMGRYLEALNPMWSLEQDGIRSEIKSIHKETNDTVSLTLEPNGEWKGFKPGQFVELQIEIDGRTHRRCYSVIGTDDPKTICIAVKAKENGFVSKYLNDQIKPGAVITISQAMGEFVQQDELKPAFLVAGGSGITPIYSMITSMLESNSERKIRLVYFNKNATNTIFHDSLKKLEQQHTNFNVQFVFSDSDPKRFSENDIPQQSNVSTYVCGPESLIHAVETLVTGPVYSERFSSPVSQTSTGSTGGQLVFTHSDSLVENVGTTILEQAEATGLTPKVGCRMGICHTCTCKKHSGAVENLVTGDITHGEENIRICISRPLGDVQVEL